MKVVKITIFLIFLIFSGIIIYDKMQENFKLESKTDFLELDDTVIDLANFIPVNKRVAIRDRIDVIKNSVGVYFLVITLQDSKGLKSTEFSRLILKKWIKKNSTEDQNALVIAIYKNEPEVNLLFTEDLDFILTKDFSVEIIKDIKTTLEKADEYMKISLKEGKSGDTRYKTIIGDGIFSAIEKMGNELTNARSILLKAEYDLKKHDDVKSDNRIEKVVFDNPIVLTLILSLLGLIGGTFIYFHLKSRCPQCGARLQKEEKVISYPKYSVPGIKENSLHCNVCGYSHREREVFFDKKIFRKR
ncbi:MAG: hypothetical protein C0601_12175 [Candidatus Muiribacterium halophilum]|uniref:TPM domain-containing protein n=1 Tax=Muiribacterium halophilum TaxID=2053465 RepID=A0A2N5ZAP0_MUIH1|nr:MAG: hypothetical protein C0601_12175 [Candidatus Muirbacterium halophilum]